MLGKLQRNLERRKDGRLPVKFRFDIQVVELRMIPESIQICRVVWSRGAKVLMTDISQVEDGVAHFAEKTLSQVATVYKGPENTMESKEYTFKVLVPRKDKNLTLGKGTIDLGQHASVESEAKNVIIPIKFSAGSRELGNGELQLIVSNTLMKGFSSEDGMTVMSGLSGLSSQFDNDSEQDLSGFDKIQKGTTAEIPPLPPRLSKRSSDTQHAGDNTISASFDRPLTPIESEDASASVSLPRHSIDSFPRHSIDSVSRYKLADSNAGDITEYENRIQELEDKIARQKKEKAEVELQLKESIRRAQASMEASNRALERERAEKIDLEEKLSKKLQEGGEAAVVDAVKKAVAVWESRYNKIQQEYEASQQRAEEDLDELNQHLLASRQEAMGIESKLQATERAKDHMERERLALEATLMETSSDRMDLERIRNQLELELTEVRSQLQKAGGLDEDDGGRVMTELIEAKVSLAELHESYTVTRHELYKSRETNMLLASKMTKLETYLYNKRQADSPKSDVRAEPKPAPTKGCSPVVPANDPVTESSEAAT